MREQRVHAVADQVGGGLVAGVEQEDAVVQQLGLGRAARRRARPGSAASARRLSGSPGAARRSATSAPQVVAEVAAPPRLPRASTSAPGAGSSADRIASDQSRSGAALGRAARRAGCRSPRPGFAPRSRRSGRARRASRQPVEQRHRPAPRRPASMRAIARWFKRAHHQPPHARVQRRIVEHEARGVVLEERRVAELRRELALLVGAGARRRGRSRPRRRSASAAATPGAELVHRVVRRAARRRTGRVVEEAGDGGAAGIAGGGDRIHGELAQYERLAELERQRRDRQAFSAASEARIASRLRRRMSTRRHSGAHAPRLRHRKIASRTALERIDEARIAHHRHEPRLARRSRGAIEVSKRAQAWPPEPTSAAHRVVAGSQRARL